MKITIRELRSLIKELVFDEQYAHDIIDDNAFNGKSALVDDNTKTQLRTWLKKMKLTRNN